MLKGVTPYERFFNKINDLDMDDCLEVRKLAINFRKWIDYNKGEVIIDIYESYTLKTIVVIHNFFDEIKICNSWDFLQDVEYVLDSYADSDESFTYMTNFWYEIAKI